MQVNWLRDSQNAQRSLRASDPLSPVQNASAARIGNKQCRRDQCVSDVRCRSGVVAIVTAPASGMSPPRNCTAGKGTNAAIGKSVTSTETER